MARVIDGNKLALKREADLRKRINKLKESGIVPKLAIIVMKDDSAGQLYSRLKKEAAKRVGIELIKHQFEDLKAREIIKLIKELNKDEKVQGIVVQRPGISWGKKHEMDRDEFEVWWKAIVQTIELKKDVDGLREGSRFLLGAVKAVQIVMDSVEIKGRKMVIAGSKGLMGRRLVKYFFDKDFEVKGFDMGEDLSKATIKADILISATGKEGLITSKMVKKGAIIIDMGWPRGDVKFNEVKNKAGVITPVPGGIGPLTVVSLLENLVEGIYNSEITHIDQLP